MGLHEKLSEEDRQVLLDLKEDGVLFQSPSQDDDDLYCIQYAYQKKGFVLTTDMFRDHKWPENKAKQVWQDTHLISFMFIDDDFLPNPDSQFAKLYLTGEDEKGE